MTSLPVAKKSEEFSLRFVARYLGKENERKRQGIKVSMSRDEWLMAGRADDSPTKADEIQRSSSGAFQRLTSREMTGENPCVCRVSSAVTWRKTRPVTWSTSSERERESQLRVCLFNGFASDEPKKWWHKTTSKRCRICILNADLTSGVSTGGRFGC